MRGGDFSVALRGNTIVVLVLYGIRTLAEKSDNLVLDWIFFNFKFNLYQESVKLKL